MTFDYGRIEIVAALINYPTLILIGIYLIYEGGMRMIDPPEVAGWTVVILGGVARDRHPDRRADLFDAEGQCEHPGALGRGRLDPLASVAALSSSSTTCAGSIPQ